MTYGRMPLFPPPTFGAQCGPAFGCAPRSSLQMPLFNSGCDCAPPQENCQCVRIQNPACPGEYADVELCVDMGGNLSICVRRPPKPSVSHRKHMCKTPGCGCYSRW